MSKLLFVHDDVFYFILSSQIVSTMTINAPLAAGLNRVKALLLI